jgi:small subunit ribosomal protein S17
MPEEKSRNLRRTMIGKVVSDKMEKTIVVAVERSKMDETYGKIKKVTYKLKARDEKNEAHEGDTVKVMETRPLSKDIRWRLVEVTEKAVIK